MSWSESFSSQLPFSRIEPRSRRGIRRGVKPDRSMIRFVFSATEKLGKADSLRLREKVPTLSQRTRKNRAPGTRAKADSE